MLTNIISRVAVGFLHQNQVHIVLQSCNKQNQVIICPDRQTITGQAIICRSTECQTITWRSDEGEVLLWSQAVVVFVFFKEFSETLEVNSV